MQLEMSAWATVVSDDGNSILKKGTPTLPFSSGVVNCRGKTDKLIRKNHHMEVRKMAVEIGIGHHAFQEMMENSG